MVSFFKVNWNWIFSSKQPENIKNSKNICLRLRFLQITLKISVWEEITLKISLWEEKTLKISVWEEKTLKISVWEEISLKISVCEEITLEISICEEMTLKISVWLIDWLIILFIFDIWGYEVEQLQRTFIHKFMVLPFCDFVVPIVPVPYSNTPTLPPNTKVDATMPQYEGIII